MSRFKDLVEETGTPAPAADPVPRPGTEGPQDGLGLMVISDELNERDKFRRMVWPNSISLNDAGVWPAQPLPLIELPNDENAIIGINRSMVFNNEKGLPILLQRPENLQLGEAHHFCHPEGANPETGKSIHPITELDPTEDILKWVLENEMPPVPAPEGVELVWYTRFIRQPSGNQETSPAIKVLYKTSIPGGDKQLPALKVALPRRLNNEDEVSFTIATYDNRRKNDKITLAVENLHFTFTVTSGGTEDLRFTLTGLQLASLRGRKKWTVQWTVQDVVENKAAKGWSETTEVYPEYAAVFPELWVYNGVVNDASRIRTAIGVGAVHPSGLVLRLRANDLDFDTNDVVRIGYVIMRADGTELPYARLDEVTIRDTEINYHVPFASAAQVLKDHIGDRVRFFYNVFRDNTAFGTSRRLFLNISTASAFDLLKPTSADVLGDLLYLNPQRTEVSFTVPFVAGLENAHVELWMNNGDKDSPSFPGQFGATGNIEIKLPEEQFRGNEWRRVTVRYRVINEGQELGRSAPLEFTVMPALGLATSEMILSGLSVKLPGRPRSGKESLGNTETRQARGGSGHYSYESGNTKVAKVDGNGLVVGEGNGSTTITVRDTVTTVAVTYKVVVSNIWKVEQLPGVFNIYQYRDWLSNNHGNKARTVMTRDHWYDLARVYTHPFGNNLPWVGWESVRGFITWHWWQQSFAHPNQPPYNFNWTQYWTNMHLEKEKGLALFNRTAPVLVVAPLDA
ncbi:Ig-like domain-containing protein [Pseudomonas muyukensis]|uniref:Ig-like domain-containing protein n=1 Tax=Pseudomonas muyukensis TaxID=2842357 RepID=A0ABX8M3A2_9PSED|nr:Ig-like domain-containing protein [Pseudomonas muyukensis]QXH33651.1 Ig-like domain-containing protein [Pseudomonas muyukensis]